jgi:hypothetical protein
MTASGFQTSDYSQQASWLEQTLGDVPQACIALHALRSGRCRVWRDDSAVLVDADATRGELLAFGEDVRAIARMLGSVEDWRCVEVSPAIAPRLAAELMREPGVQIERIADLYFTLHEPLDAEPRSDLRLLAAEDADRYAESGISYGGERELARLSVLEGPVVAAFDGDRIVAAVEANVRTAWYANFNAATAIRWRGRGLCTAATAVACSLVQSMGLAPLWSCAETNLASRRVAEKVGFRLIGECVYLIPRGSPAMRLNR